MSHVVYILFREPAAAEAALADLAAAGLSDYECHLFVHKKGVVDDLRTSESDTFRGLAIGLLSGGIGGALLGLLAASPLAKLGIPVFSTLGFLMLLGMICGAIGGGLSGTGLVHGRLQGLLKRFREGQTLVTAETASVQSSHTVTRICHRHGGIAVSA